LKEHRIRQKKERLLASREAPGCALPRSAAQGGHASADARLGSVNDHVLPALQAEAAAKLDTILTR